MVAMLPIFVCLPNVPSFVFQKILVSRRRPFLTQDKDRLRTLLPLADGGAVPVTGVVGEHEFAEVANAMGYSRFKMQQALNPHRM